MRFRKKELRKLLGTHTNNITKHYILIYRHLMLVWLVGPPSPRPGTCWGGPGNVVMVKREEKEIHLLRLSSRQGVLRVEGDDGRVQSRQSSRGNRCLSAEDLNCFQAKRRETRVVDSSILPLPPQSAAVGSQTAVAKLFCLQPHLPHLPTISRKSTTAAASPAPHKSP